MTDRPAASYRDAAIALWGEAGEFAHDAYARNLHLYPGLPSELPIVVGLTAYGGCVGLTRPSWEYGPRITLASPQFHQGRNLVEDTMIHEMLHAWLYVIGQETGHAGDAWYAAINRLSPRVLGFELNTKRGAARRSVRVPNPNYGKVEGAPKTLVRKVTVEDQISHGDVARWPQPFRPVDYPAGAPLNCPTH